MRAAASFSYDMLATRYRQAVFAAAGVA